MHPLELHEKNKTHLNTQLHISHKLCKCIYVEYLFLLQFVIHALIKWKCIVNEQFVSF